MFDYDGQGRVIEELEQYWEGSKGWVNYNLASYTYDLSVEVAEADYSNAECVVYPNPASGNAYLSFTLPSDKMVSLKLYRYDGTMIRDGFPEKRGAGSHIVEIPVCGLSAGVYFV